jgi:hypothetical protein
LNYLRAAHNVGVSPQSWFQLGIYYWRKPRRDKKEDEPMLASRCCSMLLVRNLNFMNKKAVVLIFVAAFIFSVIRNYFLKEFFLTDYLIKEIFISLIEISIVVFLIKKLLKPKDDPK